MWGTENTEHLRRRIITFIMICVFVLKGNTALSIHRSRVSNTHSLQADDWSSGKGRLRQIRRKYPNISSGRPTESSSTCIFPSRSLFEFAFKLRRESSEKSCVIAHWFKGKIYYSKSTVMYDTVTRSCSCNIFLL